MLVAPLCLTLCDTVDCCPPGSSVHGILQARILGVGCHSLLQGIFPTQGSNLGLLHCRQILYHLSHREAHCLSSQHKASTSWQEYPSSFTEHTLVIPLWGMRSERQRCPQTDRDAEQINTDFTKRNSLKHQKQA